MYVILCPHSGMVPNGLHVVIDMKPMGLWMEFMIRQSLNRLDCVASGNVGSFFFLNHPAQGCLLYYNQH